jgi:hypothetical protein
VSTVPRRLRKRQGLARIFTHEVLTSPDFEDGRKMAMRAAVEGRLLENSATGRPIYFDYVRELDDVVPVPLWTQFKRWWRGEPRGQYR